MSTLWEKCLQHLEEELPSQQVNTWIRPLQAQFENDELCLFAPNRFVLDWVADNYKDKIIDIAKQIQHRDINVLLKIGTSKPIRPASITRPVMKPVIRTNTPGCRQ